MTFFAPGLLEAFGLTLVRTSTFVLAAPGLGERLSVPSVKIALILSLSFVVTAAFVDPLLTQPEPVIFGCMALREMAVGLFLGFLVQGVMLAIRVGGDLIGHEMGMFMSQQVDPATGISTTTVSQLYETFFLLGFFSLNGHHVLVRALGSSMERAPVGEIRLGGQLGSVARNLIAEMFSAGLAFSAPVMVLLMLVSILLGVLARAVPQLNVLELSFTLRVGLATVAMVIFAPLLEPALLQLYESLDKWLGAGLDALEV